MTEKLQTDAFVELNESRKKFVNALCEERSKDVLGKSVEVMVNNYIILLKQNSKGKRFGQFEQAWLKHI